MSSTVEVTSVGPLAPETRDDLREWVKETDAVNNYNQAIQALLKEVAD